MKPYFEKMKEFGSVLPAGKIKSGGNQCEADQGSGSRHERGCCQGRTMPESVINKRGQITVWERLDYLVDPGTWCPLHTLYNPHDNEEGHHDVVNGLAKISRQMVRDDRL